MKTYAAIWRARSQSGSFMKAYGGDVVCDTIDRSPGEDASTSTVLAQGLFERLELLKKER